MTQYPLEIPTNQLALNEAEWGFFRCLTWLKLLRWYGLNNSIGNHSDLGQYAHNNQPTHHLPYLLLGLISLSFSYLEVKAISP